MQVEALDTNIENALAEIERNNDLDNIPLEERGGEVLDQVNEVFNLMAMNIKRYASNKKNASQVDGNETRKHKSKPNVIYIKGPRDRLLMMTESVDQSF